MCSCDTGESGVCQTSEWRTAAKVHKCCECSGTIPLGELHRYVSGIWEGDWESFRICAECEAKHDAHFEAEKAVNGSGCYAPLTMLNETISECTLEDAAYKPAFDAAIAQRLKKASAA